MDGFKRDMRVLAIGAAGLLLLIFFVGVFKLLVAVGLVAFGYGLGRFGKSSSEKTKPEEPHT